MSCKAYILGSSLQPIPTFRCVQKCHFWASTSSVHYFVLPISHQNT